MPFSIFFARPPGIEVFLQRKDSFHQVLCFEYHQLPPAPPRGTSVCRLRICLATSSRQLQTLPLRKILSGKILFTGIPYFWSVQYLIITRTCLLAPLNLKPFGNLWCAFTSLAILCIGQLALVSFFSFRSQVIPVRLLPWFRRTQGVLLTLQHSKVAPRKMTNRQTSPNIIHWLNIVSFPPPYIMPNTSHKAFHPSACSPGKSL